MRIDPELLGIEEDAACRAIDGYLQADDLSLEERWRQLAAGLLEGLAGTAPELDAGAVLGELRNQLATGKGWSAIYAALAASHPQLASRELALAVTARVAGAVGSALQGGDAPEPDRLAPEERDELASRRLTERVREAVEADLRRRYAWIGFVVMAGTGGSVALSVNNMLNDAKNRLETATALQEQATQRLTSASDQAEALTDKADRTMKRFDQQYRQAKEQYDQMKEKTTRATAELAQLSEDGFTELSSLGRQLVALSEVVKRLESAEEKRGPGLSLPGAAESPAGGGDIDTIQAALTNLDSAVDKARQRAQLAPTGAYERALEAERKGFQLLLEERFGEAQRAFEESEAAYPGYHQVFEIARLLKEKAPYLNDPGVRRALLATIVDRFSWKAPPDMLDELRGRVGKP